MMKFYSRYYEFFWLDIAYGQAACPVFVAKVWQGQAQMKKGYLKALIFLEEALPCLL
jgi:hypothetical protein